MSKTRGDLQPARMFDVDKSGNQIGSINVSCMFNPFEYTVSKSNTFAEKAKNASNSPHGELFKSGAQTLKLTLFFDTYETGEDVSRTTNQLWKFMMPKDGAFVDQDTKIEPPQVAFEWGVFLFVAHITNMSQQFTLFQKDGTPVRAKVDVTLTQYKDVNDYPNQNPSSGAGETEQVHRVVRGERLDTLAARVYGDATKWRLIADHNDLVNPLALPSGLALRIPAERGLG
ncbi:MAG: peptidoglycan-binding protein [Caldilineaceae bacterium]|nr:peptidoglycan-binding protein [Caldilineaceae bacterium]